MKDHEGFAVHVPFQLVFSGCADGFARSVSQVRRWRQLHRERAEMLRLNDAQLRDIGLSRIDVLREGCRPFWDAPLKK